MRDTNITSAIAKFIHANYLVMTGASMGRRFGFSKGIIYRYMRENGLRTPVEVSKKAKGNDGFTSFTQAEDMQIKRDYLVKPVKVLAAEMGRSYTGVMGRIKALGLQIPANIIAERKKNSRFPSGHVPMNKGKKMDEALKIKLQHTFFNKGHVPANTLFDGAITTRHDKDLKRKYKWIRVNGVWEMLHIVLWKEKHGALKPGKIIAFKDGNSLNCVIENLEEITREENMRRNSFHHYPEELKEFVYLKGRITKKVNKLINIKPKFK